MSKSINELSLNPSKKPKSIHQSMAATLYICFMEENDPFT